MYPALTNRVIRLARRTEISEDDWYTLLDERLTKLKDHLRGMTLNELGSLRYLRDYFGEHNIGRDNPNFLEGPPTFSLKTRGIFPPDLLEGGFPPRGFTKYDYREKCSRDAAYGHEGKVFGTSIGHFWGLTRNGEWVGVEVRSDHSYRQYKYPDRFEEVVTAKTVSVREMPLPELCAFAEVTPRDIWDRLGKVVEQWVEDRQHLLGTAESVHEFFEHEKAIVDTICPRRH